MKEPVFQADFLQKLKYLKIQHSKDDESFHRVIEDFVGNLVNDGKSSEIYLCKQVLTDEDLFKHIDNLLKTLSPLTELDNEDEEVTLLYFILN